MKSFIFKFTKFIFTVISAFFLTLAAAAETYLPEIILKPKEYVSGYSIGETFVDKDGTLKTPIQIRILNFEPEEKTSTKTFYIDSDQIDQKPNLGTTTEGSGASRAMAYLRGIISQYSIPVPESMLTKFILIPPTKRKSLHVELFNKIKSYVPEAESIFSKIEAIENEGYYNLLNHRINSIAKVTANNDVKVMLEQNQGLLPISSKSEIEVAAGADFSDKFLMGFFSERHLVPDAPPIGTPVFYLGNDLNGVSLERDRVLLALSKNTFNNTSRNLFRVFLENIADVEVSQLKDWKHVNVANEIYQLRMQEIFWAVYTKSPLSIRQVEFLDLVYKMHLLWNIGSMKAFSQTRQELNPLITMDSFLYGLARKYEAFASQQNPKIVNSNYVKDRLRLIQELTNKQLNKLSHFRCEVLFH